jgi:molybdate transport system ATP-binding protein
VARTLAPRPRLLLLDEPLSALDAPTRDVLRGELRAQLYSLGISVLLVTHDRGGALALGDRVAIVNNGRIALHGVVDEVFHRPSTPAIAAIVAVETIQRARVLQADEELVTVAVGKTRLIAAAPGFSSGDAEVFVCIRAEDVLVFKTAESGFR